MERLDLGARQFTQADVLAILPRLTKKTLQNWKSRGLIEIDESGQGIGNHHLYSGFGIVMLSFMARAVSFGLPPAAARKMANRVAECAQQLVDLRLEEIRPDYKYGFVPPASNSNEEYRRGFIFNHGDDYYRMEVGRKDRSGSLTLPFYSVVAIDIINFRVLGDIARHLAGQSFQIVGSVERVDLEPGADAGKHQLILDRIRTLPVDKWDEHA